MDAAQTVQTITRSIQRAGSVGKHDELLSRSAKRGVAKHSTEVHDDPAGNPDWSTTRQEAPYKRSPEGSYWEEDVAGAGDPNRFKGEDDYQAQVRRTAMEAVEETLTDDEAVEVFEFLIENDAAFGGFVDEFDGELLTELSGETLKSYKKSAQTDLSKTVKRVNRCDRRGAVRPKGSARKMINRVRGIRRADDRMDK
jgi:hypothetical protein